MSVTLETPGELATRFDYHPPTGDKPAVHEMIRRKARDLAECLMYCCPPSRELAQAVLKVEEAMFWANAAVARRS